MLSIRMQRLTHLDAKRARKGHHPTSESSLGVRDSLEHDVCYHMREALRRQARVLASGQSAHQHSHLPTRPPLKPYSLTCASTTLASHPIHASRAIRALTASTSASL